MSSCSKGTGLWKGEGGFSSSPGPASREPLPSPFPGFSSPTCSVIERPLAGVREHSLEPSGFPQGLLLIGLSVNDVHLYPRGPRRERKQGNCVEHRMLSAVLAQSGFSETR